MEFVVYPVDKTAFFPQLEGGDKATAANRLKQVMNRYSWNQQSILPEWKHVQGRHFVQFSHGSTDFVCSPFTIGQIALQMYRLPVQDAPAHKMHPYFGLEKLAHHLIENLLKS